ncbi:hypothetical protein LXT12_26470 [Pelomonas sp. P7]|uniref:Uncharacterized protein n=1 Tax=Pelomonas caseinilytica TaxID=2906763 RepID=A0ABS8XQ42_9BURK|nr:hypothetical protein [Pelomonas sp. P7]MCE4540779.1 hypothetical protein [Pelomonas sp. P7]
MGSKSKKKAAPSRDPGQWFLDHALELSAIATSMLAAACYFIGRAGLVGWYETAGVPQLVFAWPAQDIIIRGLTDEDTWLLVLLSVGGSALYFGMLSLLSAWTSRIAARVRDLRNRGETVWTRGERRLRVWAARRARRAHTSAAALATLRWRALGKRGDLRRQLTKAKALRWQPPVGLLAIVLAACALLAVTFAYIGSMGLLYRAPYTNAARAFNDQYAAATGREAPARQLPSWAQVREPRSKTSLQASIERGRRQLAAYPFVRLKAKEASAGVEAAAVEEADCGWLVQASGGVLVLLTSDGLLVKNFGDGAFSWQTVAPESCSKQPAR